MKNQTDSKTYNLPRSQKFSKTVLNSIVYDDLKKF